MQQIEIVEGVEVNEAASPCVYEFVMGTDGNVHVCRLEQTHALTVGAIRRGGHVGMATR